jgi:hypothetical protein
MKGVRTCFTDAVLVEKIYFLATAENTSLYDDEILGVLLVALTLKR